MERGLRFTVPELSVAHQALEDEVVIVHLTRGHYYSLSTTGAEAWLAVANGASIGELADAFGARYQGGAEVIEADVVGFVTGLEAESLIEPRGGDGGVEPGALQPLAEGERLAWVPLKWTKYTDLEQLLQVDPIHEVDEAGWPPQA